MAETGQPVSRGTLYIHTHKRSDGTYINEEAQAVCEKISEIENQETTPVGISTNDSLGQVFGKEHSGRVRGVGDMEFVQHKCLDPATYDSVLLLLVLQNPGGHSSSQFDTNQQ
ncbi:putative transposase, Ptta/En/Spm, plant [Sesbania bispinosa]|nr:putative transposase, Ptta/En/Spm, plant [Sesbania bispinosa]